MNGLAVKTDLPSAPDARHPTGISYELEKARQRFWGKVAIRNSDECWIWQGAKNPNGYGSFRFLGLSGYAHRIAFAYEHGYISRQHLHHLCDRRDCVNPRHLEEVSGSIHRHRHPHPWAYRTHCFRGHPFDLFNTRFASYQDNGNAEPANGLDDPLSSWRGGCQALSR